MESNKATIFDFRNAATTGDAQPTIALDPLCAALISHGVENPSRITGVVPTGRLQLGNTVTRPRTKLISCRLGCGLVSPAISYCVSNMLQVIWVSPGAAGNCVRRRNYPRRVILCRTPATEGGRQWQNAALVRETGGRRHGQNARVALCLIPSARFCCAASQRLLECARLIWQPRCS